MATIINLNDFNNVRANIDNSIKYLISELNNKGYTTNSSCSGIEEDHIDNFRTLKGYIEFPLTLAEDKLQRIRSAAEESGLKVIKWKNSYGQCLHVCLPVYVDGSIFVEDTFDEVAQEMKDRGEDPEIHYSKIGAGYKSEVFRTVEQRHDGVIQISSDEKLTIWKKFLSCL